MNPSAGWVCVSCARPEKLCAHERELRQRAEAAEGAEVGRLRAEITRLRRALLQDHGWSCKLLEEFIDPVKNNCNCFRRYDRKRQ